MSPQIDIERIFISSGHNYFGRHGLGSEDYEIIEKDVIEVVAGRGIVGDRFFDYEEDYKGQITFFDAAVWHDLERILGTDLDAKKFRRNVLVSGVDLNELIGKTFEIDGVRYSGSEEAKPCYWMDEAHVPGAEEALKGRGGLRCRILDDGELATGEAVLRVLG